MNRDDIYRLGFEAGVFVDPQGSKWSVPLSDKLGENILAFGALVAAAAKAEEREACAKVCDKRADDYRMGFEEKYEAQACAYDIRARGEG